MRDFMNDIPPNAECDLDGVRRILMSDQAILYFYRLDFLLKRPEQAIENQQNSTKVLIYILIIGGMMNAMMGRRIDEMFQGAERLDHLSVQPELVQIVCGCEYADQDRMDADPEQRHVEQPSSRKYFRHPQPISVRKVHFRRGVMWRM